MSSSIVVLCLLALLTPLSSADVVIESDRIELLNAGDFSNPDVWDISSKKTFTNDLADYSQGMIADGELSFTHDRPSNYQTVNSWASTSPTDSNSSLGEPDGYYTWSKGPDITVTGYSFTGLSTRVIANVSMILHLEVPDALPSDEIRVTIEANGPQRLVRTIARTFGPMDRMTTPMVISMDNLQEWNWNDLSAASITVDYVSDGAPDDSEVRVDAVGIRVKYHQPWYSFETVKALHTTIGLPIPVLDYGPYDGNTQDLTVENCGLTNDGNEDGIWTFDVPVPYDQSLGRIHVFGTGNHTIWVLSDDIDGDYSQVYSGDILENPDSLQHIRIEIQDGCVNSVRIDVNNPYLEVTGTIAGSVDGLAGSYSDVKFAIGNTLVHSLPLTVGSFGFQVPIGHALPSAGDALEVGVATRFQWSSDGTPESTVVHIDSMSIVGGYNLVWDLNVTCSAPESMNLIEDGGGALIAMASRCEDDLTYWEDLEVQAFTGDDQLVTASTVNGDIRIQPIKDASGSTQIEVIVSDESGNTWSGSFNVNIESVEDAPSISGLPVSTYVELGTTRIIDLEITDPDTSDLTISTSRSWATFDSFGDLILTPVEAGVHTVEISISDGTNDIVQSIEVVVTAKSDLIIENIEIWESGISVDSIDEGDIVEIKVYVRNQGRGTANTLDVRCWVDGILVGSTIIDTLAPGGLGVATCDTRIDTSGQIVIKSVVDGTASIEETNEDNNELSISIDSEGREEGNNGDNGIDRKPALIVGAIGIMAISYAALKFGPGRVRKPYRKQK